MPGHVTVWTDGACPRNGMPGAKAGIGIYWGENDPRNVSRRVAGGKQTSNRAELTAVNEAIKQAINDHYQALTVRTDSQLVVDMCNKGWINQWRVNNWKTSGGTPVENDDLVREFDYLSRSINLTMVHVLRNSEQGIIRADQLAKAACE